MNKRFISLFSTLLFLSACASLNYNNNENVQLPPAPSRHTASSSDEKGHFNISSDYSLNTTGLQRKILEILQKRSESANITDVSFEQIVPNSFQNLSIGIVSTLIGTGQMLSASNVNKFDWNCYDFVLNLTLNKVQTKFNCEAIGLWDYKSNRRSFAIGNCLSSDGKIEIEKIEISNTDLDGFLVQRKIQKIKL